MSLYVREVYNYLDSIAPFVYQEDWDNSGIQIGRKDKIVKKILLTLDVTLSSVTEAEKINADLIISHHPLFFRPLRSIDISNPVISKLIKNDITVISSHIPLDLVPRGVNFYFAELLGLKNVKVLKPLEKSRFCKLFFFLPTGMERTILDKIFSEGVGEYLFYKECAFESFGEGRFKEKDLSNPFIKSASPYKEGKIELIVRKDKINQLIDRLRDIHPYEELAFDVFDELINPLQIGYGCIGELGSSAKLSQVINRIKDLLGLDKIRFSGDLNARIKKIAFVGGTGSSFMKDAVQQGADLFISGDIKYHDLLDYGEKIAIADVGHRASEEPVLFSLKEQLEKRFKNLEILVYKEFADIYKFY